jgi:S1-C subfamily serine protease
MRDGRVKRARLGVAGQTIPLDPRLARRLGREHDTAVLVAEAEGGAGVCKGDLILAFADQPVFTVDDLHRLLTDEVAGRDVPVTVLRQAKIETLTVRPGADG